MKEIVVISGKGGTGKTSITASFSVLAGESAVVADCDVDAADMHMLMQPIIEKSENFYSGVVAEINPDTCTNCGICSEKCRFNAIPIVDNQHKINELNCEGCGYCEKICPVGAIKMNEMNVGDWFISKTKVNNTMVHAKLGIGAENSGKLVAKVKNESKIIAEKNNKSYVIVDGSPGIGCPVVSSLSGADYVILVTEPSVSGFHDLKRVYEVVEKFNIKAGCIINKFDINNEISDKIEAYLEDKSIDFLTKLPYSDSFTKAMTYGKTIVEHDNGELKDRLNNSWQKVKEIVKE